jgi:hypothetical protein
MATKATEKALGLVPRAFSIISAGGGRLVDLTAISWIAVVAAAQQIRLVVDFHHFHRRGGVGFFLFRLSFVFHSRLDLVSG